MIHPTPEQLDLLARFAHEATRTLDEGARNLPYPSWAALTREQQDIVVRQVSDVLREPDAERRHEAWREVMVRQGWRHGPTVNHALLEHPHLVPYKKLPVAWRRGDAIFAQSVKLMAASFDLDGQGSEDAVDEQGGAWARMSTLPSAATLRDRDDLRRQQIRQERARQAMYAILTADENDERAALLEFDLPEEARTILRGKGYRVERVHDRNGPVTIVRWDRPPTTTDLFGAAWS